MVQSRDARKISLDTNNSAFSDIFNVNLKKNTIDIEAINRRITSPDNKFMNSN